MRPRIWLTATFALLALCVSHALAADLDVRAGFDVEEALLGDRVGYTIIVNGTDDVEGPDLDDFGFDFDVHFVGGRPNRRSEIFTVNGRTTRREEVSYVLMYELLPRHAGDLRVPALLVRAAGEDLQTPERLLRVIGPAESRIAHLDLRLSPARVYVEQPVDLVLEISIQRAQMPGGWFEGDPWLPGRPPQLRVPWFERIDDFLTGDFDDFRRGLLAPGGQGGFHVNGQAQSSLFGDVRALRFQLPRESVIRDGRAFHVYTLRKTFLPLRTGRVELPVSSLTGELATVLQQARGQLEVKDSESVFVAHEPSFLDVLPVPEEGRPPTYTHAVGHFEVTAELSPLRAKVGDPMTLTLQVYGRGQLDLVDAPNLAAQADLTKSFQVAEADPARTDGGQRVFTFLLRPRHDGVTEVPPLQFAMFEPETEAFRTVTTSPIAVTVEESSAVQASEVVLSGGGSAAASSPGEELQGGLLGNYADDECLRDEESTPERSPLVWLLLLLPPIAFAGIAATARRRERLAADPAARRARAALGRALATVDSGRAALDGPERASAAQRLHEALAGYVADRADLPAAGMTATDVASAFEARGVSVPAAAEIVDALRDAEASRYGGSPARIADALDAAPGWLRALEAEDLS